MGLWDNILAGYNDLSNGIKSVSTIFRDEALHFPKFEDKANSDVQINNDWNIISKRALQWKMFFNIDPSNLAINIETSHKLSNKNYPLLVLNGTNVQLTTSLKYLRFFIG